MSRTLEGLDEDTVNAARDRKISKLEGDLRDMSTLLGRLKKQVEGLAADTNARDPVADGWLLYCGQPLRNDVKQPFGLEELTVPSGSFRQSGIKA